MSILVACDGCSRQGIGYEGPYEKYIALPEGWKRFAVEDREGYVMYLCSSCVLEIRGTPENKSKGQ